MSESLSAVASPKRKFSPEFKQAAVQLIVEEQYTLKSAAIAVGVSVQSLRAWHAKLAPAPAPCGESATVGELRSEVTRLRKLLHRTELERDILKKATAYFAKESL